MNNNISFCLNDQNIIQARRDQTRQQNNCDCAKLPNQNSLNRDSFGKKAQIQNVRFSGLNPVDGITWSMKKMEAGGKMTEFIVLDLLSMIIPRTYLAFKRNSKELGHPNYKAGTEEAIREFLTGPSMFIIPMGFLALGKALGGNSTNIRFDNLELFNNTFKDQGILLEQNKCKQNFSKNIFKNILSLTPKLEDNKGTFKDNGTVITKSLESHAEELADKMESIAKSQQELSKVSMIDKFKYKLNILSSDKSKQIKKLKNTVTNSTKEIAERVIKLNKYAGNENAPDLVNIDKNNKVKISGLVSDIATYSNDVITKFIEKAKNSKNKESLFDSIHKSAKTGRMLIISSTIISTGAFLYCIPLLYKRNKSYPGIEGLDNKTDANTVSVKKEN